MKNQQSKVAQFPTSKRERRRILRRSQDMRLRLVSVARSVSGWMLTICLIGFVVLNLNLFTPSSFDRITTYARLGLTADPEDLSTISFISGGASDAALFSGGLAVTDSDTLYVARPGGLTQLSMQLAYSSVALESAGDYILAYDRGATGVTVTDALAPIFTADMNWPVITASICKNGDIVVVTDERSYKNAAFVFAPDKQREFMHAANLVTDLDEFYTYKVSTSEYYIQSASLSPSGKRMCLLVFRQTGAQLEGKLLFYNVGEPDIAAEVSLGASLGLKVEFLSEDTVAALCDDGLYIASRTGELIHELQYSANDLLGYAFDAGYAALATTSYTGGARADILVIRDNGKQSQVLQTGEEIQSLSLGGGTLGLLTSAGLHVYDTGLAPLWSERSAAGASRVLMHSDGTAYLIFGKEARLLTARQSEDPIYDIDNTAPAADTQ